MVPFCFLFQAKDNNAVMTLLVMGEVSAKSISPKAAACFGALLASDTLVLWSVLSRLVFNLASD